MPPTTLNSGDIAIVGYITNGSPDSFSIVNLVPIGAGTVIYFTDNGWTGTGFRGVTASDADGNENLIRFTANADIPAGTVIRSIDTSPSYTWTKSGAVAPPASGSYLDISLNQGGDQIAALQSTGTSPLLSGFAPVYQIDYTGAFENATDSGTGNVIPGLSQASNTAVITNISPANPASNPATYGAFNFNTLTSGTREQWLAAIANPGNWTFGSLTALPTGTITVGSGTPTANLSVSSNSGSEAGTTAITVTATASSPVSGNQTLNLGVSGTGITASDYTLSAGTITIPSGATSGSVTFTVLDDAIAEGTETAILTLSNPSSGIALGSTTTQNITILDNDQPADLVISQADSPDPIAVGNPLTYTLTVGNTGGTNASGVTVQYTLPSGVTYSSATVANGFSVSQSAGVVTFTGGSVNAGGNATLTVNVIPTVAGTLTSGTAVVDPANAIAESNEINNTAASVTTTVSQSNASLVTTVSIPGSSTDLAPGSGANVNRLGGFGSDFFYDYRQNVYYGLVDRGPGGGTIAYSTRVEKFSINIDPATGAINSYQLLGTIPFIIPAGTTLNGITYTSDTPFNGLNSTLLNGNGGVLGQSQDPEGFVVGANGNFFVSDEYGPSIYEFSPTGQFVRAFTEPTNVIPTVNGSPYYAGDVTSTTGRQDNRGYEGLAISPDGTKLFAVFQDPLQQEGSPSGRNSPNVRIVRFDVATGQSDAQYIYQLESLSDINSRIPGTADDFGATSQGRNIGISSIVAINDHELLVDERDNRGVGVGDPLGNTPVGSKRVYKIDLTGATDVSGLSLSGTNTLPSGVNPVGKSLFLDIAAALQSAGQKAPEKIEGLAIGPQLSDGSFALVVATDNDFSVTQNSSGAQLDVYTNGISTVQVAIDSPPPAAPAGEPAYTLIPSSLYSFKTQPASLDLTPLFDFSLASSAVTEGNTPGFATTAQITVTRRGDLTSTDTVQIQLANGTATGGSTATAGVDYNNSPLTVTFNPGEASKNVLIPIAGDTAFEPDETVNLTLANPSAGTLVGTKQATAVLTIQNDDAVGVRIHDIQGASHTSPLSGQNVTNIPGIVTAIRSNGFYLQDPNADSDDRTSEGIFVFTSSAPTVSVGDAIQVSGRISEFRPGASATNLTTTEIVSPVITTLSSGNSLPSATILGNGGRAIPTTVIENDAAGNVETSNVFDPAQDGIDFYESLEGMRVQINNPVSTSPTNGFGEIWVLADNGTNATGLTARGGSLISPTDFNPERIQIDDTLFNPAVNPAVNVGDKLSTITGVVDYSFSNYEVLPTTAPTVTATGTLTKEVTALTPGNDQLTVATFNVENLDISDGAAKFNALADRIVNNLKTPDIISLEEIQDNNGATNNGVVDASTTYQTLISAIAAAGGPTYQYRQIDPVNNQDGGEPGGNIRVGFLFNPSRVSFVDRGSGTSTSSTTVNNVGGTPQISDSPGRIDPTNPAFNTSRKPLVGEFQFNGQTVFVVGNHFNSKGGDQPLYGPSQPPTLSSEVQRRQQAQIVNDFVDSVLAVDPNANIVVLGDLNDFQFSEPLNILKGTPGGVGTPVLQNLLDTLPANERYTYNFEGNAQVLDQILTSNSLFSKLDGYDVVHINSEFANQDSDHDPGVARFNFGTAVNVINGTSGRDNLTGTSGSDRITGGFSADNLIGGAGSDEFVYTNVRDAGDRIADFTIGSDKIVLTQLLDGLVSGGYSGTDAIADGYIRVVSTGSANTFSVELDADGTSGPGIFRSFIAVQGPGLTQATLNNPSNFTL